MPTNLHPQTPPRYGRIPQVTRAYGINRTRVYELIATGRISAIKDGRSTLIELASVDAYLASLPPANIRLPKTMARQAAAAASATPNA